MSDDDATMNPKVEMEPKVEWLSVVGEVDTWRSLGLSVTDDGMISLVGTSIRLVAGVADVASESAGIVGWVLSGVDRATSEIDGLATEVIEPPTPTYANHQLRASGLDHVVVLTPDLERTSAEITAATGCELKRIREVGTMRQGFHRIGRGGLVVELVERPELSDGPATFWGLVLIVDDLDAACDLIGPDRISGAARPSDRHDPGGCRPRTPGRSDDPLSCSRR